MIDQHEAGERVLTDRIKAFPVRIGQGLLLGALAILVTRSWLAPTWLIASNLILTADLMVTRKCLKAETASIWRQMGHVTRTLCGAAYALISMLFLLHPGSMGLAAAVFVGCAVSLNNAIITRGVRSYALSLVGPAGLVLILTPLLAKVTHHNLSWFDAGFLTIGAVAYSVFIAVLSRSLSRQDQALREAMFDLQCQRDAASTARRTAVAERARWRGLFESSPIPQLCFDASAVFDKLSRRGDIDDLEYLSSQLGNQAELLALVPVTDATAAALTLFGIESLDDGLGEDWYDESLITGLALSLRDADSQGVLPPFPASIKRPDGSVAEVMTHVRILNDSETPWAEVMVTFIDITDFQAVVRDQAEAMLAAQAASMAKSEFLAIMSHEIRTPMNGVLGMAQVMTREPLSPVQRDRLDVIRQSGEALLAILNDVLDLSKIEAGKLELETAPFDLEAVAQGAHATFTSTANSKRLSFNLRIAPEARGAYLGDSARVRQVLYNLISNAVKFTAEGGVKVTITPADPGIRIEVEDTGVGIPADRQEKLFAKFVQADSSTTRQFGGTGLGLAISRELAEAMGGTISVESREGEGSRFTVVLPLPRADGELCLLPNGAGEAEDPDLGGELRILAAEDNPINQLVLKTLLAQFGLTPQVVDNGQQAVAAWEAEPWDLILMDVQMPVQDGPSAARAIRIREAESGRPRTPIIALTANAMTHQVDSYLAAGMDGFVAKPIEIRDLMEAINSALIVRAESDAA